MKKLDADWLTGGAAANEPDEVEEQETETTEDEQEVEETEEEESEEEEEYSEEESEEELEQEEAAEVIPTIINTLAEDGILEFDPEHTYSAGEEGFAEVIEYTVDKRVEDRWNALPEDFRSLHAHLEAGLPLQDWIDRMDPTDYANADTEDEATQEILVREMYKAQGLSEATIEKKVQKLKEKADLEEEAAEVAQPFLVERQKKEREEYSKQLEKQQQQQVRQQQEFFKQRKAEILQAEDFDGVAATKQKKEELFHYLYTPEKDGTTPFQKLLSDPKKLEALAYKAMTGVAGEYVQRKATTKATGTLKKALTKYSDTRSSSTGKQVQTNVETKRIPTQGMPWSK